MVRRSRKLQQRVDRQVLQEGAHLLSLRLRPALQIRRHLRQHRLRPVRRHRRAQHEVRAQQVLQARVAARQRLRLLQQRQTRHKTGLVQCRPVQRRSRRLDLAQRQLAARGVAELAQLQVGQPVSQIAPVLDQLKPVAAGQHQPAVAALRRERMQQRRQHRPHVGSHSVPSARRVRLQHPLQVVDQQQQRLAAVIGPFARTRQQLNQQRPQRRRIVAHQRTPLGDQLGRRLVVFQRLPFASASNTLSAS